MTQLHSMHSLQALSQLNGWHKHVPSSDGLFDLDTQNLAIPGGYEVRENCSCDHFSKSTRSLPLHTFKHRSGSFAIVFRHWITNPVF
jgi:hypothetical protein